MGWLSQRASKRVLACLAVIGAGGIAGVLAGFSAEPVQTSELSAAQIVALRFSGGGNGIAADPVAAAPTSGGYVLASAEPDAEASSLMFSPFPTYASPAAALAAAPAPSLTSSIPRSPAPAPAAVRPSLPPQLATASHDFPAAARAYAAPELPAEPAARPENPAAAPTAAKRAAAPHPASPNPAAQGPASPSNAVLNSAQIASIRERLKLTSYQNQLWPAVESALRDISYQGRADGRKLASNSPTAVHGAQIDPNSAPVQRLKSAAFPLIMSLSEDQKQEVRSMVRLMGLENLASQF
jgi:hypothetical protein